MYQPKEEVGLWCVASANYTSGHQQHQASGPSPLHHQQTPTPTAQQNHHYNQNNQNHHHHHLHLQGQPQSQNQSHQQTSPTAINNNNNSNNNNTITGLHQQYGNHHTIDSTTLCSNLSQGKKLIDKGSDEYKKRRERNNVAVRKSREKAKMRSRETERRVAELSKENQLYRAQYEELRREFNVLKSLLLKTGLTEQVIEEEAQRHTNNVTNVAATYHMVPPPHYTNPIGASDQWTDGAGYADDWTS